MTIKTGLTRARHPDTPAFWRRALPLAAAWLLAACTSVPPFPASSPDQPEAASGYTEQAGRSSTRFAVAAANPLATAAGYQVLKAGGAAIDAAVAVQMVLTLVEPQSSGIGGGAFLLHHDGTSIEAFDGRETAPAAVDERLFLGADGKPLPFYAGVVGGRAVGVPGAVRMLEMAHQQHGKRPWAELLAPAIRLAEEGFPVSARLHTLLQADRYLINDKAAAAYFYQANGQPWPVGSVLRNPALAEVLKEIAAQGARGLLEGEVAQDIVSKVRGHATNPGQITLADLAAYQAKKRAPLCHDYRAQARDLRICGMPPPSSGAITIAQILGMLSNTPAASLPLTTGTPARPGSTPSAQWLHLYTEAARLAFADRAQYIADPDFVQPPAGNWESLLAPSYLASRAQLIDQATGGRSIKIAPPGRPGGVPAVYAPMAAQPEYGTSHISIVDAHGNALAMTTTVENQFGARLMVRGFLLNNQLTDFSFAPTNAQGQVVANRVQPGKRPQSSMAPTLVFDKASGQLLLTTGSPGGAMIIHYTAKTLYGVLNWGLNVQQAINLPNFGSLYGPILLEEQRFPAATLQTLRNQGHEVREQALTSGLQGIARTASGFFGGADPRREGLVMGD